jgi:DNA adenine methylase
MLIPYIGEKSKLKNFITPYIPTDISTYVEPFGGVMGVFFSLNFSKLKDVIFVYNDINHLNYNLFNQLRYNSEEIIDLIKSTNVDKELYDYSLRIINTEKDSKKLALHWLIILTCSSPKEIGKNSWVGDMEFEVFKLKWKAYQYLVDKIDDIYCLDYKNVIEKYDSDSAFFYVDPPYMGKEKYYINHNFNKESHYDLARVLNKIKGRFILSYYYFDGIEELYPNCRFESKKTIMGTEWLIMNY